MVGKAKLFLFAVVSSFFSISAFGCIRVQEPGTVGPSVITSEVVLLQPCRRVWSGFAADEVRISFEVKNRTSSVVDALTVMASCSCRQIFVDGRLLGGGQSFELAPNGTAIVDFAMQAPVGDHVSRVNIVHGDTSPISFEVQTSGLARVEFMSKSMDVGQLALGQPKTFEVVVRSNDGRPLTLDQFEPRNVVHSIKEIGEETYLLSGSIVSHREGPHVIEVRHVRQGMPSGRWSIFRLDGYVPESVIVPSTILLGSLLPGEVIEKDFYVEFLKPDVRLISSSVTRRKTSGAFSALTQAGSVKVRVVAADTPGVLSESLVLCFSNGAPDRIVRLLGCVIPSR